MSEGVQIPNTASDRPIIVALQRKRSSPKMTQSAAGTCPTSCMIKKTVISAATIVMPRAHRKELTGLKALKGIGRDPGA
ncbi:hypothetical protein A0256_24455 (plasmid) [Mucilaginibacter sp. PAMC 26640]|nr:hypothetical protein A0256_24455 [Mucilaginibacter sp. PAMC 26640]